MYNCNCEPVHAQQLQLEVFAKNPPVLFDHKFYVAWSINLRSHSPVSFSLGMSHHYAAAAGVTLSLNLHHESLGAQIKIHTPHTATHPHILEVAWS